MQVAMGSVTGNAEIMGKLLADFNGKIKLTEAQDTWNQKNTEEEGGGGDDDIHGKDEGEEEEDEFSFACTYPDGSPISADDIFQDGHIRPMFPLFDRDLLFAGDSGEEKAVALRSPLKKLFVEGRDDSMSPEAEGPCCPWRGKAVEQAAPQECRKSNSTGFSKLRMFRERVLRSNSDGKDAFVFLNHQKPSTNNKGSKRGDRNEKIGKEKVVAEKKGKRRGEAGSSWSAHAKHYVKKREMKEGERRKSYLPYRQDLVGFFTNVNGFSRNVHPF